MCLQQQWRWASSTLTSANAWLLTLHTAVKQAIHKRSRKGANKQQHTQGSTAGDHTSSHSTTDVDVDTGTDFCEVTGVNSEVSSDEEDEQEYMVQSIKDVGLDECVSLITFHRQALLT